MLMLEHVVASARAMQGSCGTQAAGLPPPPINRGHGSSEGTITGPAASSLHVGVRIKVLPVFPNTFAVLHKSLPSYIDLATSFRYLTPVVPQNFSPTTPITIPLNVPFHENTPEYPSNRTLVRYK